MLYVAHKNTPNKQISSGDTIRDFREETAIFMRISQKPRGGSSGKIETDRGEFYPTVFDLVIVDDSSEDNS